VLKYVVPLHVLAPLMWVEPAQTSLDHGETACRLRSVERVWRTGGRVLVSPNCLERSLVLYRILAREGIDPRLVLGLSRADGTTAGHAWVELQGRTFQDSEAHLYERMGAFGRKGLRVKGPSL
jgi:hypothetical protein